jgi:hypothetical protein
VSVPITFLNKNDDYNIEGFAQNDSNTIPDEQIDYDTIDEGEITHVNESYRDYEKKFAGKVKKTSNLFLYQNRSCDLS